MSSKKKLVAGNPVSELVGFTVLKDGVGSEVEYTVFRISEHAMTVEGKDNSVCLLTSTKYGYGVKLGREYEDAVEGYLQAKDKLDKLTAKMEQQ